MDNKDDGGPAARSGQDRADRRSTYRLPLAPGAVAADLPGATGVPLIDLSADGGRLLLPPGLDASQVRGVLHLSGHGSFGTELELVGRSRSGGEQRAVGVRFQGISNGSWHSLGDFLIGGFLRQQRSLDRLTASHGLQLRVRDEASITALLRLHGLARGQRLSVYNGGEPLPVRLRLDTVNPGAHLDATSDAESALQDGATHWFLLPGLGAAVVFTAFVLRVRGRAVRLSFPEEILEGGVRDSLRHRTQQEERAQASFPHQRADGLRRSRALLDVSDQGLSFPLQRGHDLILPGDRLEDLRLSLPTGTVTASAIVRSVAPRSAQGDLLCGVEILGFEGASSRRLWESYVFAKACPHSAFEGPDVGRTAWRMLESSGYLELWTRAEDRERLERQFHELWRWPRPVAGHLVVIEEGSKPVGTFATSRLYPKTWLIHSLGVDRETRRRPGAVNELARELYAGLLRLLKGEPQGRYFVLFVQRGKRWTDLLYGGFVRALPAGAPSVYDCYELYKCWPSAERGALPLPAGLSVRRAQAHDLAAVGMKLGSAMTALERDAYGYGQGRRAFRWSSALESVGLRREVFVAADERGLLAALVAESGSEGVNIFGLLNSCRIFPLRDFEDPSDETAVHSALLAAAHDHYGSTGVLQFILLATSPAMSVAARASGASFVSDGVRWLASCELLPAWMNYIEEALLARAEDGRDGGQAKSAEDQPAKGDGDGD